MITLLAHRGSIVAGATATLPEEEAHHLRVRRAREGDVLRLADGDGVIGRGVLVQGDRVAVHTVDRFHPPVPLSLAVAIADKDRWGTLAEKAAELGVTELIPLETERSAGVASRLRAEHLPRIQRRALEAIKQSGTAWAPVVQPMVSIEELIAQPFSGVRWLADVAGVETALAGPETALQGVIGPEGGFTERERRILVDGGFTPIRLGPLTMRFETAALAMAVVGGARRQEEQVV